MRARNHFNDVSSWSGVVELSGKKPWMMKIGAILAELCACEAMHLNHLAHALKW